MSREKLIEKLKAEAAAAGVDAEVVTKIVAGVQGSEELRTLHSQEAIDAVIRERQELKEKLKPLQEKLTGLEMAGKSDLEKARAEIESLTTQINELGTFKTRAAEADAMEGVLKVRLEDAVKSLPEGLQKTIPESLSLVEKLNLAEGLVTQIGGAVRKAVGSRLPNGTDKQSITSEELAKISDPVRRAEIYEKRRKGEIEIITVT